MIQNPPQNYYPSLVYDTVSQRLNIICITNCAALLNCTFKVRSVIAELTLNSKSREMCDIWNNSLYTFLRWVVIFGWRTSLVRLFLQIMQSTVILHYAKAETNGSATCKQASSLAEMPRLVFLTLSYGLAFAESQRGNKEAHLGYGTPVVQDADAPHARPQRLVERRAVVRELGAGVDQNVIGGGDDVGRVDPHDRDGDVRPFGPLLHAHRLIHGAHEATEVSEHAFFGIPLCTNLREQRTNRRVSDSTSYCALLLKLTFSFKHLPTIAE